MRTQRNTEAEWKEGESTKDWNWNYKSTIFLGDSTLIEYEESYSNLKSEQVHITEWGCNFSAAASAVSRGFSFFCLGLKPSLLTATLHVRAHKKLEHFACKVEDNAFNMPNLKSVCFILLLPEVSSTYFNQQNYAVNPNLTLGAHFCDVWDHAYMS